MSENIEKKSNKGRLLFLVQYLQENTDNSHGVTRKEIETALKEAGYSTNAKTLDDDLNTLLDSKFFSIEKTGSQGGINYFYYLHTFDPAEIKMLIDAVAAARFISQGTASRLTDKLLKLSQNKAVTNNMAGFYEGNHVKTPITNILSSIELIQEAITEGKQITFQYYEYDIAKNKVPHNNGEIYTFSPYAFAWNDDRYYLLGQVSKRPGRINPMRVDLIYNIAITDNPSLPAPDGFSPADYTNKVFKMFSEDNVQSVTLDAPVKLMKNFIARFGEGFHVQPADGDHFHATVQVSVSPTFFAWVFQYNEKITIVEPQEVKNAYSDMLKRTLAYYSKLASIDSCGTDE